jgi:hypothetical protein
MADFEYAFASSGTPNSFAIDDSGITGIDEAGTITPTTIKLAANIHVLLTATKTKAEIAQAMLDWLRPRGYAQESSGGPGARERSDTNEATPALTEVDAAD